MHAERRVGIDHEQRRRNFLRFVRSHGGEIAQVHARFSTRFETMCWFVALDFASGCVGHVDLIVPIRGDFEEGFQVFGAQGSVVGQVAFSPVDLGDGTPGWLGLGPLARVAVPYDAYRAPEAHHDAGGDIYAFGATLYHLVTGQAPPRPPQPVEPPGRLVQGLPASFDRLLLRALASDPEARFRSTREIVHAFDAMVTIG